MASKKIGPFFEVVFVQGDNVSILERTPSRSRAEGYKRILEPSLAKAARSKGWRGTAKVEIDSIPGPTVKYPGAPLETIFVRGKRHRGLEDDHPRNFGWEVLWRGESNGVVHETFRDADDYARSLLDLGKRMGGLFEGTGEEGFEFEPGRRRRHLNDPSRSRRPRRTR